MLDITFIRQNEDIVKMAAERRGVLEQVKKSLSKLLKLDDERRAFTKEQHDSPEYAECIKGWRTAMLEIPNIPDISTPNETVEVERVGNAKPEVSYEKLWYERDGVRVYTDTGTKLLESVASMRESFFTNKGYSARIVMSGANANGGVADTSHYALLERPVPSSSMLTLGAEVEKGDKNAAAQARSSTARAVAVVAASHAASVEKFEAVRAEIVELCTLLHIPYTLESIGANALPASAVKMYRLSVQVSDSDSPALLLAEWYYEHDYTARRYGMLYDDAGKRRFAHTVRLNLGKAHTWLRAVVMANTKDNTCFLPLPLQSRFENGLISL